MGQNVSQSTLPAHPVAHKHAALEASGANPLAGCPMHKAPAPPAKCPVDHGASSSMNPQNNIPRDLSAVHPLSSSQSMELPTERVISSIPRPPTPDDVQAAQPGRWEYPSPQQFYNALVRKGWETPEEHVETMVEIHNFLNEEAWLEVLKWEKRWSKSHEEPELARLEGKPGQLSPKARIHLFAGWFFPLKFNTEPPFDRHDWVVRRPSTGEEVRYVIDYYSAPDEPDGSPAFNLDVRPALDSVGSIQARIAAATEDVWKTFRASPSA